MSIKSVKNHFAGSVVKNLVSVPLELHFENHIYLELCDVRGEDFIETRVKVYFKPPNQPCKIQLSRVPNVPLVQYGEFTATEMLLIHTLNELKKVEIPQFYYEMLSELINHAFKYCHGSILSLEMDYYDRLQMRLRVTDNTGLIIIQEYTNQKKKLCIYPSYFQNWELHPIKEHCEQTYDDIASHIHRLKAL